MPEIRDDFIDLYGSIKPRSRPEDFKKIRDKVRRTVAKNVVSEDRDSGKLYGIKRQEP